MSRAARPIEAVKISEEVHDFMEAQRVGRLATADAEGAPHVVPVCYAFDGHRIYSALDLKPKRVHWLRLKRVRNIEVNPSVALVIDRYSEDWSRLAYVLIRGVADIMETGEEQERAVSLLRARYPQYDALLADDPPMLRITPDRVVSWGL